MDDWRLPWDGGCRCGGVRLRVNKPPLVSQACHCTGCQSMTASAYSLTLSLHSDGFELTAGEPVLGGLHGATRHFFCAHCKSWLFTRPEGLDWLVNLRPSSLDQHAWFSPFVEVYTQQKLPWATTSAVHSYAGLPKLEEYEGLMADYAKRGARPA
jgi:hypothetical protein